MIAEKEECNDKNLRDFFKGLEEKYAPSTLWVVLSCVNCYFVEKFGKKLKEFPHQTSFLKNKTHRSAVGPPNLGRAQAPYSSLSFCLLGKK